ncbi:MAG TPA: O-antigen ligase family protein [Candidatus Binatia bacterium]|nr:O-antigen ligase family protein [Candidatus Binatia bacterium]
MAVLKKRTFTLREITSLVFTVLVAFAPSGTRWILKTGSIAGHPVEPGTVSVFGMQLVAIAFAALVFGAYGWKGVTDAVRRPAGMFAACVALAAMLSSFQAQDALAGLTSASFAVTAVAVFLAIQMFRPDPREVLTGFVGGAVFQVALGGYQFFTQSAFASKWLGMATHSADQLGAFVVETGSGRWLRAYGSLSHPNIFGLYVGIGLLMCIALAAYRGHGRHTRFYALMPLIAAGLLFSFSRSAILGVAAGFLWMVVSAYGSVAAPEYRRVLVPSFIIIAVTAAALALFYGDPLLTRATANGRLEAQSIGDRGNQYTDAMSLLADHLFTGVGIGQMPLALARESANARNWWQYDYVHNVPVLVAVETGILGLIAWLGFVGATLLVVRDRLMHKSAVSSGVTVYAAAFLAMLVASLFDHFLWSSWFGQLLFWCVAGLLHAAYLDLKKAR